MCVWVCVGVCACACVSECACVFVCKNRLHMSNLGEN